MNEMAQRQIWPLLRGAIHGLLAALALLLTFSLPAALIVYFSPLSETALTGVALLLDALAAGAGGWYAARRAGSRGLLCGALTALFLAPLLLLIGPQTTGPAAQLLCCVVPALIGGIVGVK